jgi:tagatose-1,6-bisphosphate aldolase non-catalytic subunit AgaZ/GatZ
MRGWLRRRRERAERIETEAEELIRLLGGDAYGEARWREQMASSRMMAQEWNLIALAIGRQTGRRVGLDLSTRMAMNVVFAPDREQAEQPPRSHLELAPSDELKRILTAKPQPFRIQFVGAAPDRGLSILGEVEVQALDVSAAVVAAANLAFPPKTIALRILDREGQEVFERHKADRPITERSGLRRRIWD